MVKAMVGIIVIAVIGVAIAYYAGGVASYDPGKKGEQARAAINPGMTWKQVIDAAGEPGKYETYVKTVKTIAGEKVEDIRPTAPVNFDRQLFDNEITNKTMPDGFVFVYFFTHQVAFNVHFDGAGIATFVEDATTAADIFKTRK